MSGEVDPEQARMEERLRLPPLLQALDRSRTSFHEEHHETVAQTTAREHPPTARRSMSAGASASAPLHSEGAGAGGDQPPEQASAPGGDQASAPSSARSDASPKEVVPDSHDASPSQHLVGRGGAGVGDEAGGSEEVAMPQEVGVAAGADIAADIDGDANSSSIQGVNAEAQLALGQTDGHSRQILRVAAIPRRTKARSGKALKKAWDLGKLEVVHL